MSESSAVLLLCVRLRLSHSLLQSDPTMCYRTVPVNRTSLPLLCTTLEVAGSLLTLHAPPLRGFRLNGGAGFASVATPFDPCTWTGVFLGAQSQDAKSHSGYTECPLTAAQNNVPQWSRLEDLLASVNLFCADSSSPRQDRLYSNTLE